jgi:uncharacterized protein (TIGR02996 family)
MATATEEVLADLVDRADRAIQRWLDRAISSVQEAIAPILEEALFLGEARTSLDSETAREELRRLLAETTFHGGYLMEQPELPDHPRDPATGRWLTEGEAELVRLMGNLQGGQPLTLPQGTTVHYVRPNPNLAALSRLLWLLDLSEGERAFVRAAADEPCDLDGLSVFADWLEERQRGEADRFRESLSMLTDEQLEAAGLVRKDGLAEREKEGIKSTRGQS